MCATCFKAKPRSWRASPKVSRKHVAHIVRSYINIQRC